MCISKSLKQIGKEEKIKGNHYPVFVHELVKETSIKPNIFPDLTDVLYDLSSFIRFVINILAKMSVKMTLYYFVS